MEKHEYLPVTSENPGARIEDLIRERKITQAKLAEAVGVSAPTMSRYVKGDAEMPHTVLLKMAKYFGVTTDFLLGVTNIPFTTNYDIEKLGLTEAAARNLLTKTVNIDALNWLLTQEAFLELTQQIDEFRKGTVTVGMSTVNQIYGVYAKMLNQHVKVHPQDKRAASLALHDLRENMSEPTMPQTALMFTSFEKLIESLKRGATEFLAERKKMNGKMLDRMIESLEVRKNTFDMKSITVDKVGEMIADCVMESGFPEDQREEIKDKLVDLFRQTVGEDGKSKSRRGA